MLMLIDAVERGYIEGLSEPGRPFARLLAFLTPGSFTNGMLAPEAFCDYRERAPYDMGKGPWDADRIIYAGMRRDGYGFFGYVKPTGLVLVLAGCRCLTLEEAKARYEGRGWRNVESTAFINVIEQIARVRYPEVTDSLGRPRPEAYYLWSKEQDKILLDAAEKGATVDELASACGVTVEQAYQRLRHAGLA